MSADTVKPLRVSLSQPYVLRWAGVTYTLNGVQSDPRPLFVVQYQLLLPDVTTFATWATGAWETNPAAGSSGPFAASLPIGPGQPPEANPGAAGLYRLWLRYLGGSESPAFAANRMIELATP